VISCGDQNYASWVTQKSLFWKRHPGLAWSNPDADDATRIRAALLRPRFQRLLDIASEFGLDRLQTEWAALSGESDDTVERAKAPVKRILRNIEAGFNHADSRS
jgi:hypothetical protein